MKNYAYLILEDGLYICGRSRTKPTQTFGELVFNTSMTGYQEALTDPSYKGQILMLTYPLIGNYGTNNNWQESEKVHVEGFVVSSLTTHPSNSECSADLAAFLDSHNTPLVEDIDTRYLTTHIREKGVMDCTIKITEQPLTQQEIAELVEKTKEQRSPSERDLISEVAIKRDITIATGNKHVVLIDCGYKKSIVDELKKRGCGITIVRPDATIDDVLTYKPDGVLVSNGPGDPARAKTVISLVKDCVDHHIPLFGICLGHQIINLAMGSKTYKMKFGHRGANQPVLDLQTKTIAITSQNHGFAVECTNEMEVTHINLNDKTVEGTRHPELPIFTTQYHPEAHPGPWDSRTLFDGFVEMM